MNETLQWTVRGERFSDGSLLRDWIKIEDSGVWHWQYDTHELTFAIYEHDGQFWKLYRARFVPQGGDDYAYDFGGQACRMALVEYLERGRSPHSSLLKQKGEREWVRTYEVDERLQRVLKAGEANEKYGAPYGPKDAASGRAA